MARHVNEIAPSTPWAVRAVIRGCAPLLLLVFLAAGHAHAADAWWNDAWRYRVLFERDAGSRIWTESPDKLLRFPASMDLQPGGRDLRAILPKGEETPLNVIWAEPGQTSEATVRLPAGVDRVFLYFGNPDVKSPPKSYTAERGLVLETRERPPGGNGSLAEMRALIAKSRAVYGRGTRANVWDGFNPYGPNDNFLSVYRGWFRAPVKGVYAFATASDDASFLLIDGQPVCEWPGSHGAGEGAWGAHSGTVDLEAGMHRFEYLHEQGLGDAICVAGWKKPGDKQFALMPEAAFPGFPRLVPTRAELRGAAFCPAFIYRRKSEVVLPGDRRVVEIEFGDQTTRPKGEYKVAWEFGDGVTSEEASPAHVYLSPGQYQATLTVSAPGGESHAIRRLVQTDVIFHQRDEPDRAPRYCRTVAAYPFARLPAAALKNALVLFSLDNEFHDAEHACRRALLDKAQTLSVREQAAVVLDLADHYFFDRCDLVEAEALYRRAADMRFAPAQARGSVGLARVALETGDPAKAEKLADEVVRTLREVAPADAQQAQIVLGDAALSRGDLLLARRRYDEAARLRTTRLTEAHAAVLRGAYPGMVENYLTRGETEAALETLNEWETNFPTARADGLSAVLRTRALIQRKTSLRVARRELLTVVRANPASNNAPEALLYAGDCARLMADDPAARDAWERIGREYPESPLAPKAAARLARLPPPSLPLPASGSKEGGALDAPPAGADPLDARHGAADPPAPPPAPNATPPAPPPAGG